MLHGLESSRRHRNGKRPSAVLNAPSTSAFAIVIGAIGYLLITRTRLGLLSIIAIGAAAAFMATTAAAVLLAHWALPHAGHEDETSVLQGLVARVTRSISPSTPGEIAFQSNGAQRTITAESVQESEIPRDTEVVIESIQNGVARVELWSTVEQRL
jgi:hypothetical protein